MDVPRPSEAEVQPFIHHSQFVLNTQSRHFTRTDRDLKSQFTRKEMATFMLFATNPNHLVANEQILNLHGSSHQNYPKTLINRIRRKISDDPEEAERMLKTIHTKGYLLEDPARPIELVNNVPSLTSFHVVVDSDKADDFRQQMEGEGIDIRELEPGVDLFLNRDFTNVNAIDYPPLPQPVQKMEVIQRPEFNFDPNTGRVLKGNKEVGLTPSEARLLFLMLHQDAPIESSAIADYLSQNTDAPIVTTTVNVYITRLRTKLSRLGIPTGYLKNIRGSSRYTIDRSSI